MQSSIDALDAHPSLEAQASCSATPYQEDCYGLYIQALQPMQPDKYDQDTLDKLDSTKGAFTPPRTAEATGTGFPLRTE